MASNIPPDNYILFDIPTKARNVCWSMNTWRSRLLLNYKSLEYKTEWLEYPDIGVRLSHCVPPNEQGPLFTLPAIKMPDGSYVMGSYEIADIIEEKHPEPSVLHNTSVELAFRKILVNLMGQLTPIYVPEIEKRILSDKSVDFFVAARQKDVGMALDDYRKWQSPGAIERAEPFIHEVTALLNKTSSGPYFLGESVSYTDFIWAAILLFFKSLGDDMYEELLLRSGDSEVHTKFLDALSLWTQRND